jgi:glycosyltransferase involved in cell wall biosynthesis
VGPYIEYFKQAGHDVHFIALSPSPPRPVPTYNVGIGKKYSATEGKWKYPISMLGARRLVKKLKPDIVHTHYATSGGLAGLVCGFHPTIVTVHGSDLTMGMRSRIWRALLKAVFNQADCINTVSRDLRDMAVRLGISEDKIEVLTLGIDTEKFRFVERPPVERSGELRLICTRRMEPIFEHGTIIQALTILKNRSVRFKASFVGDGSLMSQLQQQVAKAGLTDKVCFLGRIDNSRLPEVLRENDIYLSASLWDGTSLSLLEAMASGIFPIVSDIRANSAWLKHGVDGLLHKVGDAADIAGCIMKVLEQPELISKAVVANRQRVAREGDRNKNMKRLECIYESLINKADKSTGRPAAAS